MSNEKLIAFKATDKDFKCRGFQYEVGKTYEHEGTVEACSSGFHACENPLDVLNYYDLTDCRFAEVEMTGELSRHGDDSKIASATITIRAELKLPDFLRRAINFIIDSCEDAENTETASGYNSQLAASGYNSKLAASGDNSKLAASGYNSKLAASGDNSKLAASGYYSQLAASGDNSQLAASGYNSKLAASGHNSKLAASGDYSQLAASGDNSVIASSSNGATAKGGAGTWVSLAEYDRSGKCVGFATGCIGTGGLEPDTWYRASGGKLVPA